MQINNLTKYHAGQLIFAQISAVINKGEHIGLVGANGTGKTTLLRILSGEDLQDEGELVKPQNYHIGYLKQMLPRTELSLAEYLTEAFADLLAVQDQMHRLEQELASPEIYQDPELLEAKMDQYAKIQQQWEDQGGYTYQARIHSTVLGLGLTLDDLLKPLQALSGGQRVRAQLARLLLEEPDLLLLDEPSNHLDLDALEWLEGFLQGYPNAVIIASHDRYFLDRFANRIWEMADHQMYQYKGGFSAYLAKRQERIAQTRHQAEKQQEEIAKIEAFIRKFGAGTRASQAKSLAKRLAKLEPVAVSSEPESMKFKFQPWRQTGVKVVEFSEIYKKYDQIVLNHVSGKIRRGDRIALLGANGSGKSTLLKILAGRLDYQGTIEWGANVDLGYFDQELEFEHNQTVLDELYLTFDLDYGQLRNILAQFLFKGDQVFQPVQVLSGGERNRLLLAKLFLAAPNFLVLDEPTNHLDIYAREALESALSEFSGTMLFVTHDRYLVDLLATKIWILEDGKITEFAGNYSQYREHLKTQQQQKPKAEKPKSKPQAQVSKRKLAQEQERIEAEIFRCEQEKAELEAKMAQPEFYQDPEQIRQINLEYHKLTAELEDYYQQWEALIDAIQIKDDG